MLTVELHQAFLWSCPDCLQDNFERAVQISPEEIESRGIDILDYSDWKEDRGDGFFLMAPDRVKCPNCGSEFETVSP